MRALLWRGIALALAGCCSWLLWHWPEPTEPEAVEFALENDCGTTLTEQSDGTWACWSNGEKIYYKLK